MRDVNARREPFERILEQHRDKVFRLAWSILGNRAAAEDAAQDVFLKIWTALPGFRGESSISTWIYAVARNTCLTRRQRENAHPTIELDETIPGNEPSSDADLRRVIARLPEKYRDVLVLFYLEDRSYEQVAEALDLPMGTVKTNLHRAKKEIAVLLAGKEHGPCLAANTKS
jgi:RNA polymerase sigma-70 factor (ECF subfamily)